MKRILIYNSGGGLGDSIQLIQLILSLQNHFKRSKFFYLGAHENHFNTTLKDYDCKINTLDLNIKYFGFRWWHPFFVRKELKKHIKYIEMVLKEKKDELFWTNAEIKQQKEKGHKAP